MSGKSINLEDKKNKNKSNFYKELLFKLGDIGIKKILVSKT